MTTSQSWQRDLYAIWIAEFIAIAGTNAIMPILPLYIDRLGVYTNQEVAMWAGVVFSIHAVTLAIFSPLWGVLSDHMGRKLTLLIAVLSATLTIGSMGAAQNVGQLVLLRALQGALASMIIPAASTIVSGTVPRERVGYALGMLRTVLYVGAAAGPILGGLVADGLGYRATFWVAGLLLLLATFGVWRFVREQPSPVASPDPDQVAKQLGTSSLRDQTVGQLTIVLGSLSLLAVLGVRVLMRLGFHATRPILPLFIQSIVPTTDRVASISGLVSGVSMAAGAVGAVTLGRLGDRVGYRKVLVACAIASAVGYLAHYFVASVIGLLLLQAWVTLAMSGILATLLASLAQVAPKGKEGALYGVDQSVDAVVGSIGPVTGSTLAVQLGLRAPFIFAAGVFGLAGAAAARWLPREQK